MKTNQPVGIKYSHGTNKLAVELTLFYQQLLPQEFAPQNKSTEDPDNLG